MKYILCNGIIKGNNTDFYFPFGIDVIYNSIPCCIGLSVIICRLTYFK
nr:MAG TPA: hypothetical protein [Caudoviricetes sp.]